MPTKTHPVSPSPVSTPHTEPAAAPLAPATPTLTFADLRPALHESILRAVAGEGYTTPTPIQAQAIPHVAAGRDVLGCAQTGTGKTAAFSLPILHRLAQTAAKQPHPNQHHHRPIRALILSPTRELALQIEQSLKTYGRHLHLRTTCVFGGVGQGAQTRALQAGVDMLIATPGRLQDLMNQGYIDLSHVEIFVLDEADRMLDMGFITPIREITSEIPKQRQTLLFSATMPKEIRHLADSLLTDPVSVQIATLSSTPDLVDQSIYHVTRNNKPALLVHILETAKSDRVLVFTRTKHGADRVTKDLVRVGIRADAIHGNKRQNVRQRTLGDFRNGRIRVLVATDVAARGIDVDGISHVINFDLPNEPESYVHRIGRTARAGTSGQAISFCDRNGEERDFLRDIERLIRKPIRVRDDVPELAPPGPVSTNNFDSRGGGGGGGGGRSHRSSNGYGGGRSSYGNRDGGRDQGQRSYGNRDNRDSRDSRDSGPREVSPREYAPRVPTSRPPQRENFGPRDAAPSDRKPAYEPRANAAPHNDHANRPARSPAAQSPKQDWTDPRAIAPAPSSAPNAAAAPQGKPKKMHRKGNPMTQGGPNASRPIPSTHKPGTGAGKPSHKPAHAPSSATSRSSSGHAGGAEVHVRKPGFNSMNKRPTRPNSGGPRSA